MKELHFMDLIKYSLRSKTLDIFNSTLRFSGPDSPDGCALG